MFSMTKQTREAFLADVHVGIISIPEDGRGPLAVPVWYAYESGGEPRFVTGKTSRKGRLLERAGRFSLCVQTETPPYQYASVDDYIARTREEHGDNVLVRMRPERWLTADYGQRVAS